jgi:hypothetical protein
MHDDAYILQEAALTAVTSVATAYGLPRARLKPCVACLLDGNPLRDRFSLVPGDVPNSPAKALGEAAP